MYILNNEKTIDKFIIDSRIKTATLKITMEKNTLSGY